MAIVASVKGPHLTVLCKEEKCGYCELVCDVGAGSFVGDGEGYLLRTNVQDGCSAVRAQRDGVNVVEAQVVVRYVCVEMRVNRFYYIFRP